LQLIEDTMPLAVSYKIVTHSKMNRTKQRVSAAVHMLTALGLTTFRNAQIKPFFLNPTNCSETFLMFFPHKIHKMDLGRENNLLYIC
jgi:hypothetical protein